jgi:hypothetical protein
VSEPDVEIKLGRLEVDVVIDIREALLLEVHRAIETASKEAVLKVGRLVRFPALSDVDSPLERSVAAVGASLVLYPPMDSTGAQLSSAETAAIAAMSLSPEERSGLEKLVADAAAAAFFRFFCLLDGVADPEVHHVDNWSGAVLAAAPGDEDRPMLHDELFESYWRYREASRRT